MATVIDELFDHYIAFLRKRWHIGEVTSARSSSRRVACLHGSTRVACLRKSAPDKAEDRDQQRRTHEPQSHDFTLFYHNFSFPILKRQLFLRILSRYFFIF